MNTEVSDISKLQYTTVTEKYKLVKLNTKSR